MTSNIGTTKRSVKTAPPTIATPMLVRALKPYAKLAPPTMLARATKPNDKVAIPTITTQTPARTTKPTTKTDPTIAAPMPVRAMRPTGWNRRFQ